MTKRKKIVYSILLIILLLGGYLGWQVFGPTVNAPQGKYFYIPTGSKYENVKESLVDQKILNGTFIFDQLSERLKYRSAIKPGRYEIKNGISVFNLVRMLRAGNQSPVNLVITKLRTKQDLAQKIGNNFECDSSSVMAIINNEDSLHKYRLDSNTVMTAVIPNTYSILWNTPADRIFKKLEQESEKFWNDERKGKAQALNMTTDQVYTMASIVEEETNKEEDKGNIASVYLNRIRSGQKLEADPTIKFALKNFGLKRIRSSHVSAAWNSPFNTYSNKGLPPGPICTPSSKTIDAVLNVPSTDYLYFVAKPDWSGLSTFTHSYEQHLVNAKNYQRFLDSINIR
jgi:UPF0755 protein